MSGGTQAAYGYRYQYLVTAHRVGLRPAWVSAVSVMSNVMRAKSRYEPTRLGGAREFGGYWCWFDVA